MRKLFYWAFAFSLCALMGCKDDGARVEVVRYAINEPVFMSISEFRNSVKVTDEVVPITKPVSYTHLTLPTILLV